MSRSKRIISWAAGLILVASIVALGLAYANRRTPTGLGGTNQARGEVDAEQVFGGARSSRAEAKPGNQGESGENPAAAAEEAYANRAYPDTDIPFQLTLNAQSAFQAVKGRGSGKAKNNPGTWQLIGPEKAQSGDFLNSGYGGSANVMSGRTTALAIAPTCDPSQCRLYVGAAGGGVWRTDKALAGQPQWQYISGSFATSAIGTIVLDPRDPSGNTVYVGTGEPNASSDSGAGMGIYKSTDGGNTWTLLAANTTVGAYSGPAFNARAISTIVFDPNNANTFYVASTRGVRGFSAVTGGATTNPPVAAPFGLYKTTDGGATFSLIWNGNGTIRGVVDAELDPQDPGVIYASAFQQGIWRSSDGGATWERVFASTAPGFSTARTMFDLTVKDGKTRAYAGDGAQGAPPASVWRVDDINVPAASLVSGGANVGWTSLTSSTLGDPKYGSFNYCTGQCWYDNDVVSPAGYPDMVFVLGSFSYDEIYGVSNARGMVVSLDAGNSWYDWTADATAPAQPDAMHPDHHEVVVNPNNPYQFFNGSDGGVMRSDGTLDNNSAVCASRGLDPAGLATCQQLLSQVPHQLDSLNNGLSTLQFQSLSVNPQKPMSSLMGGTQDNGTWEFTGSNTVWNQVINGDGGQSGFDAVNPGQIRVHTYYYATPDISFQGGQPRSWNWIGDPIYGTEPQAFYVPLITDPKMGGWMWVGTSHVWRTKDSGGPQAYLEQHCNEFTGDFTVVCGDWVPLGDPSTAGYLTATAYGSRAGGNVAAVERAPSDSVTLWAATSTGRVFISKNADAEPASAVVFTRLDNTAGNAPGRFVSGIYVDPANPNRAWISYSGYSAVTPLQPGHVFEVVFKPSTNTATWTNLDGGSGPLGDLPVTDIARDDITGDLYAGSDFGVSRLPFGTSTWLNAGSGLPAVEIGSLEINSGARVLYAATHGRGAWMLRLP